MNAYSAKTRSWSSFSLAIMLLCVSLFPVSHVHTAGDLHAGLVSTNTRAGRLAVFDAVWETIDERYYDPKFGGVDWTARSTSYRLAAAEAKSSQELYRVLRNMLAALNDPHTRVYSPLEKFDWWKPRFVSVGLAVREIEGVPTIVQVDPGSAPARAGVRSGDQLISIDGIPVAEAFEKKLAGLSLAHASRAARFHAVATLFEGDAGTAVKVVWRTRNGKTRAGSFVRYWNQLELGFQVKRKEDFVVVDLEGFTQQLVTGLFRSLSEKLNHAEGVVLDLRRNGGGDADAMAEIADLFLDKGVDLGSFTDRAGSTLNLIAHGKSIYPIDHITQRSLPLVVLVSERTSSAAEILAAALQSHHRAQVLGTPTCGCVLAIRSRYTLPDDGVLDVSEFDYKTAEGKRLEGCGVEPDALVQSRREDLYTKRDRALDLALELLSKKSQ